MTKRLEGVSRRDFSRIGAFAGPASLLAACGWDGGPVSAPKLQSFSRLNDWVGEKIFQSSSRLAREYPTSARTSMGNFPSYSISYNQTGVFPSPDPAKEWVLQVGGL